MVYHAAFVALASRSFDRLVQFYSRLLQQDPQPYWPERYAEFQLPGLKLGIFQPGSDQRQEFVGPAGGGFSLCLEVGNLEQALAIYENLGDLPTASIQTPSHGREAYIYDPEGNRLILYERA